MVMSSVHQRIIIMADQEAPRHAGEGGMSEWIEFVEAERLPKTVVWYVQTKDSRDVLGQVRWFGRWRKYAFYPYPETIYEQDCLRQIAAFVETETKLHRRAGDDGRTGADRAAMSDLDRVAPRALLREQQTQKSLKGGGE